MPKIIMAENVKGLKPYLPVLEEEYEQAGYKMYYTLFNSKYWGVPQNRERYFVVGVRHDIAEEFVYPVQQTDFIPKLSSVLEENVDDKYYISDEKTKTILEKFTFNPDEAFSAPLKFLNRNQNELPTYAMTADCSQTNGVGYKVKQATKKGYDIALEGDSINISHPNSKTRRGRVGKQVAQTLLTGTEQVVVERDIVVAGSLDHYGNDQMNRVYSPEGVSPTALVVSGGGGREIKILEGVVKNHGVLRQAVDGIATCCDANYFKGPDNHGQRTLIQESPVFRVRKLTPREYARLQGFPDSFEQVVSNSQFYKQMGNAVTVNVAEAIATAIKEFLQ